MQKTFLLGVGAQKAGTTSLYDSLKSIDKVNFGVAKEYHIWNATCSDSFDGLSSENKHFPNKSIATAVRYRMRNEHRYYCEYFNEILSGDCILTGDITPAYSVLSSDTWKRTREILKGINAQIRVVFLMRDPFERCRSAVRTSKRKKNISLSDDSLLLKHHIKREATMRTRYDRIVQNLRASFSTQELYLGVYETMHRDPELQRLSSFLGVNIDNVAVQNPSNSSPKHERISCETEAAVKKYYREVYEFCWNEFPNTRLVWRV